MRLFASTLSAVIVGLMPTLAFAADPAAPTAFTPAQKAEVEAIVRDLLTKKDPEIVMMAAQEIQRRESGELAIKSQKAASENHEKLYNDANAPVGGNAKGGVTLVEFFDYQCGYCKKAQDDVLKLLNTNKDLRVVYKEFPILGPTSVVASKAALASVKQDKYIKFHDALLAVKDHLSDDSVFKVAKDVGLDVEKLKKDMEDPAIAAMLKANQDLGGEIGARGTPTFVVGDQVYPGAIPYDQLKQSIDDSQKTGKK